MSSLLESAVAPAAAFAAKTPSKSVYAADRFISSRDHISTAVQLRNITNENEADAAATAAACSSSNLSVSCAAGAGVVQDYHTKMANDLLTAEQGAAVSAATKILALKVKAPKPAESHQNNLRALYSANVASGGVKRVHRVLPSFPERVLDAPSMTDDYYLNLLDWSSTNVVAVALGSSVYLWNAETNAVEQLMDLEEGNQITSLSWMSDSSHIGIGLNNNDVQLWNVEKKKKVRSMDGHSARVSSLSWNREILSSGGKDAQIINHDVRVRSHKVATLVGHTQEVCGLKWNIEGTQLASGANDNVCCIWDAAAATQQAPRFTFNDSMAAVKALAWCPFQSNLLATGSGTADRHIRFYNTQTGALLNSIDTKSQVCSLQWSKTEKEILSSHGFSQNQLCVWKYPTLVKVGEMCHHNKRVLHTALSPDGTMVASAAADERLCFWRVWDEPKKVKAAAESSSAQRSLLSMNIR